MSKRGSETGEERRRKLSSRQAVRRVRRAFAAAEEGALQAAYADVRWRTRVLRACLALADRVYPVSAAIDLAGEMDRRIRADGLSSACRAGVGALRLDYDIVMSEATRSVLASAPVIVYGNHPTLLTPFLVGAAIERDLRFFMLSYVGNLIPSLRAHMLPLEVSSPSGWREWRSGGHRRVVAHWLTRVLDKDCRAVDAKPANRKSLGRGAQHVHGGGCVVIFPSGGGRKDRAWYPGIGQLARQLARDTSAPDVYLVPMREEQSSNGLVYKALRRIGGASESPLRPLRVRFAEPRRLLDLVDPSLGRMEVARRLQLDYETEFPAPRTRWITRILFPWRLAWGRGRV